MIHIILGMLYVCIAWSSDQKLFEPEHASFTMANRNGPIAHHFSTIYSHPELVDIYSKQMIVYAFIKKSRSTIDYKQILLKDIQKKHITCAKELKYQLFEYFDPNKKSNKIYVFLGFAEGKNKQADDIVNDARTVICGNNII